MLHFYLCNFFLWKFSQSLTLFEAIYPMCLDCFALWIQQYCAHFGVPQHLENKHRQRMPYSECALAFRFHLKSDF